MVPPTVTTFSWWGTAPNIKHGFAHALKMRRRSAEREILQHHAVSPVILANLDLYSTMVAGSPLGRLVQGANRHALVQASGGEHEVQLPRG